MFKKYHHSYLPVSIFAMYISCIFAMTGLFNELKADFIDREPGSSEVDYSPAHGEMLSVNPPSFVWLPENSGRASELDWVVQYSKDSNFSEEKTYSDVISQMTIHVPTHTIEPGTWYWRYKVSGTNDYSDVREFQIPEDATEFPFPDINRQWMEKHIPETRPRVYFTPEDVQHIRENQDKYSEFINPVIEAAEDFLESEIPLMEEPLPWEKYAGGDPVDWWGEHYDPVRLKYLEVGREIRPYARGMSYNALAYIYTGEKRFADEAKRWLMNFMEWDIGEEDVDKLDSEGNPMDAPASVYWPTELGLWITEHSPRTFDWIYDTLNEEEREKCVEVLGRRIRQVYERHRSEPFEADPFGSHAGRLVGFGLEGQLVMAHEDVNIDRADEPIWNLQEGVRHWLDYTLKIAWSIYPAWGDVDGGYYEGIHYWKRYMGHMLRVVVELDRLGIPLKNKPFFKNTGDFGLYAVYPHRPEQSFGDGYEWGPIGGTIDMEEDIMYTMASVMYSLSSMYNNPYYLWASEQVGGRPSGPEAYRIWNPELEALPPYDLPQSKAFFDVGWVAMHSDIANPKENVLLLFQSSPYGSISHNHALQNAFVLEAFTEPLAISSGYYQDYSSPHHSQWVWQSRAHNTILVDGIGQEPKSSSSRGRIVDHMETGDWTYALGDANEAYFADPENEDRYDLPNNITKETKILERAYRHILFMRDYPETGKPLIIMVDDLKSHDEYLNTVGEEPEFQWLFHAHNEMIIDEESGEFTVEHGQARMRGRFLGSEVVKITQKTGWEQTPRDYPEGAPPQFHLTASTDRSDEAKIVSLLMPYHTAVKAELPDTELIEAEGGVAVRINDSIVLIKDPEAEFVNAAGYSSSEPVTIKND